MEVGNMADTGLNKKDWEPSRDSRRGDYLIYFYKDRIIVREGLMLNNFYPWDKDTWLTTHPSRPDEITSHLQVWTRDKDMLSSYVGQISRDCPIENPYVIFNTRHLQYNERENKEIKLPRDSKRKKYFLKEKIIEADIETIARAMDLFVRNDIFTIDEIRSLLDWPIDIRENNIIHLDESICQRIIAAYQEERESN